MMSSSKLPPYRNMSDAVDNSSRYIKHRAWCEGRDAAVKAIVDREIQWPGYRFVLDLLRAIKSPYEDVK